MKIVVKYDSVWFKDQKGDFRGITKSTVMGILHRLIGEQRPLKDINESSNHYYKDIESNITYNVVVEYSQVENLMLQKAKRGSSQTRLGMLYSKPHKCFTASYANKLWQVLFCGLGEFDSVLDGTYVFNNTMISREAIRNRLDEINGMKDFADNLANVQPILDRFIKLAEDGIIPPIEEKETKRYNCLYSMLFYYQVHKIEEEYDISREDMFEKKKVSGIAPGGRRSITVKDFMTTYIGEKTYVYATPMKQKFPKKDENFEPTKGGGSIEITIDKLPIDKQVEIKEDILNAGVSTFYVGKKGLGYCENIIIG